MGSLTESLRRFVLVVGLTIVGTVSAAACSRVGPFSFDELFTADVIVRAAAARYVVQPDPNMRTTGVPESQVEFDVREVLSGDFGEKTIILKGYLSDRDDFNDVKVPYTFVRPMGRSGSCYANTYKQGADFLLFLEKMVVFSALMLARLDQAMNSCEAARTLGWNGCERKLTGVKGRTNKLESSPVLDRRGMSVAAIHFVLEASPNEMS
jgi:hypothetical protein